MADSLYTKRVNTRNLQLTTAPAALPVTLSEVKQTLRVSDNADDASLTRQLTASVSAVEGYINRSLITRTYTLVLDGFPEEVTDTDPEAPAVTLGQASINLPMGPLQSIDSFTYLNDANQTQIVSPTTYTADTDGSRVLLNSGNTWPTSARAKAAVRVQYVAGYGASGAAVPPAILEAIYQVACRLYEGRGCCGTDEAIKGVMGLLAPYRTRNGFGRTY